MTADAQISPRVLLIGHDVSLDESLPAALREAGLEVERIEARSTERVIAAHPSLVIVFEGEGSTDDAAEIDAFVRELPDGLPVVVLSEAASLGLETTAKRLPRDASPAAIAFRAAALIRAAGERVSARSSYTPPRPKAEAAPAWNVLRKPKPESREAPGRTIKSSLPAPPNPSNERPFSDSERPTAAYPRSIESLPPAPRRPRVEVSAHASVWSPSSNRPSASVVDEDEAPIEVSEAELRDAPSTSEPETRSEVLRIDDAVDWWDGGSPPEGHAEAPEPTAARQANRRHPPRATPSPEGRRSPLLWIAAGLSGAALVFLLLRPGDGLEPTPVAPSASDEAPPAPPTHDAPPNPPAVAPPPAHAETPAARNEAPQPEPVPPNQEAPPPSEPEDLPRDPKAASDALVARARPAVLQGDLAAAEPILTRAIAIDESNPRPYEAFARLYLARRDGPAALAWIDKALKRRPKRAAYHVMRGDALKLGGDTSAARKAYEKALALDPRDRDARARVKRD